MVMIARMRLCLTASKDALVAAGDERAAFLYASIGDEIPDSAAEQFGLVDGLLPGAEDEATAEAQRREDDEGKARADAEAAAQAEAAAREKADLDAAAAAEAEAKAKADAATAAADADKEAKDGKTKLAKGAATKGEEA